MEVTAREECWKAEKDGLDVIRDIPAFAEKGYKSIPESDFFRLRWYGLFHDKPKDGHFMLRIRISGGCASSEQLRVLGTLSKEFGQNYAEITTRQQLQLHLVEIEQVPAVLSKLETVGLNTKGTGADNVRNICGCPVAGLDQNEVCDATPVLNEVVKLYVGNKEYSNLPRKFNVTITGCASHCTAPEISDIGGVAARNASGEIGYTFLVGGGLGSTPHLAKPLPLFVSPSDVTKVMAVITSIWKDSSEYRARRSRARFKFLIDDWGLERFQAEVEKRMTCNYSYVKEFPRPASLPTDHMGVIRQKQEGFYWVGVPVTVGRITAEQLLALADLTEKFGNSQLRFTHMQNFIIPSVPAENLTSLCIGLEKIGFKYDASTLRTKTVACTGLPYCNYSILETKTATQKIIDHLENVFGNRLPDVRIGTSGCPFACGQHWMTDIGLIGCAIPTKLVSKKGFDIAVGGSAGKFAGIGRVVRKKIPDDEVKFALEKFLSAYLSMRDQDESLTEFCVKRSAEELGKMFGEYGIGVTPSTLTTTEPAGPAQAAVRSQVIEAEI